MTITEPKDSAPAAWTSAANSTDLFINFRSVSVLSFGAAIYSPRQIKLGLRANSRVQPPTLILLDQEVTRYFSPAISSKSTAPTGRRRHGVKYSRLYGAGRAVAQLARAL